MRDIDQQIREPVILFYRRLQPWYQYPSFEPLSWHHRDSAKQMWRLRDCYNVRVCLCTEGDPLLLGTPFVVILLTVLRSGKERPSLTVGHARVLLATTGPKDADLPGLYWLGSLLVVTTLAPRQLSHSRLSQPFIKALKTAEQRGFLCLDDRM